MRGRTAARRSCREDEVAMTLFLIEYAAMMQVFHFFVENTAA
jgi:hypothetical protein